MLLFMYSISFLLYNIWKWGENELFSFLGFSFYFYLMELKVEKIREIMISDCGTLIVYTL